MIDIFIIFKKAAMVSNRGNPCPVFIAAITIAVFIDNDVLVVLCSLDIMYISLHKSSRKLNSEKKTVFFFNV